MSKCECAVTEQCDCGEQLADELEKVLKINTELLDGLERIQDYAWSILHDELEGQDQLDEGWVWRVAHDTIYPCTCDHSTWGGVHDNDCPRSSEEYKVR